MKSQQYLLRGAGTLMRIFDNKAQKQDQKALFLDHSIQHGVQEIQTITSPRREEYEPSQDIVVSKMLEIGEDHKLRRTEIVKHNYEQQQPEWQGKKLRPTSILIPKLQLKEDDNNEPPEPKSQEVKPTVVISPRSTPVKLVSPRNSSTPTPTESNQSPPDWIIKLRSRSVVGTPRDLNTNSQPQQPEWQGKKLRTQIASPRTDFRGSLRKTENNTILS